MKTLLAIMLLVGSAWGQGPTYKTWRNHRGDPCWQTSEGRRGCVIHWRNPLLAEVYIPQQSAPAGDEIAELRARVAALEKRVKELEAKLAPAPCPSDDGICTQPQIQMCYANGACPKKNVRLAEGKR